MRIDLIEKLVLVLVVMCVLAVAGLVTTFSILPPRSGIPDVADRSALATMDWLKQLRDREGRIASNSRRDVVLDIQRMNVAPPPPPTAAEQQQVAQAEQGPTAFTGTAPPQYFDPNGNLPTSQQIPGIPWLRNVPGWVYAEPQRVPEVTYRKYQSFEETWNLVQEGGGEFVTTSDGNTAYQVNWVDQNSMLASRIGLRPGDKVISVNGQPVGASLGAGQAMFEQLKNERRFAVLVERQGQPVVLSFYVQ